MSHYCKSLTALAAWLTIAPGITIAADIGTAFTYQGSLEDGSGPVTDTCDFRFGLWDADVAGAQVSGSPLTVGAVDVVDGTFTADLDFGVGAINGDARWLEIEVQCPGDVGYTLLSPRVELTPAPHATRAVSGVGPPNAIEIDSLNGRVGIGTAAPIQPLHVVGTMLSENPGTSPAGSTVRFGGPSGDPGVVIQRGDGVGGVARQWEMVIEHTNDLEIRDNTAGGLERMVIDTTGRVGIGTITPSEQLTVAGTVHSTTGGFKFPDGSTQTTAATGGGGTGNTLDGAYDQGGPGFGRFINADSGPVEILGDGLLVQGIVQAGSSIVIDGISPSKRITSDSALEVHTSTGRAFRVEPEALDENSEFLAPNVLAGSAENELAPIVIGATISGGGARQFGQPLPNRITDDFGTIGGGFGNLAGDDVFNNASARGATVCGGLENQARNLHTTVGGGQTNSAVGIASTVAGGSSNDAVADFATVSGGASNQATGVYSSIGGGDVNIAAGASSVVGGGSNNVATDDGCVIAGGSNNQAGDDNGQTDDATFVTIGGGTNNIAAHSYSTISGGINHLANGEGITIGGGQQAIVDGAFSTVSGGSFHTVSGEYATIGGGTQNQVLDIGTTIAGGRSNTAWTSGASIGGGIDNEASGSTSVIAGGGLNRTTDHGCTIGGGGENRAGDNAGSEDDATYATVAGGRMNVASGNYATVSGGSANDAAGDGSTVSGGQSNDAIGIASSIGGGQLHMASGNSTTISGGFDNLAADDACTVGGGMQNQAGDNLGSTADRSYATVSGGLSNIASGFRSTIGGGGNNLASGFESTIGGGNGNWATNFQTTVCGGRTNIASGIGAVVGGGEINAASNEYSVVAGGSVNTASGENSVVGGGSSNTASGDHSAIGGGATNTASGDVSIIPGGVLCEAVADYSFAAGRRAKANHQGSFVWADSVDADVTSLANNHFSVRTTGGARFYSNSGLTTGVNLAAGGGSWSSISDRNLKRNIEPVDSRAILNQLTQVPLATWNYESQDESIRHIGPMAQDFHAAFAVGEDERYITAIDADGVALAAIQGLHQIVQEKNCEIESLDSEISNLKSEVDELKSLVKALADRPSQGDEQ